MHTHTHAGPTWVPYRARVPLLGSIFCPPLTPALRFPALLYPLPEKLNSSLPSVRCSYVSLCPFTWPPEGRATVQGQIMAPERTT